MKRIKKNYLKNPYLLLDEGFVDVSSTSTDSIRTVLFQKEISPGINLRIQFARYISDVPDGKYSGNHQVDFEEISLNTTEEESGCRAINSKFFKKIAEFFEDLEKGV